MGKKEDRQLKELKVAADKYNRHPPLSAFLLPVGDENRVDLDTKNIDWVHVFISAQWQDTVKKESKKAKEYTCDYCNGTGFLLWFTEKAKQEFYDLMTKNSDTVIEKLNKTFVDNVLEGVTSKEKVSDLFSMFTTYLDKTNDILPLAKRTYNLAEEAWQHQQVVDEKSKQVFPTLQKNFRTIRNLFQKAFPDSEHLMLQCPYCGGSGYYDVGHKFLAGKQNELLLFLYNKYILEDKGNYDKTGVPPEETWEAKWNQPISLDYLLKVFKNFAIEPQIGKSFERKDEYHYDFDKDFFFASWKINQHILFTKIASVGKIYLRDNFSRIRKEGPQAEFEETFMTIEEIKSFFDRLISTAPVDTGLLRRKLEEQQQEFIVDASANLNYEERTENAPSMATAMGGIRTTIDGKQATPFIGVHGKRHEGETSYLVIEGPTRLERFNYSHMSGSTINYKDMESLYYPYAMDYVPNNLLWGGKQKREANPNKEWGGDGLEQIVKDSFRYSQEIIKNHYIIFFPQTRVSVNKPKGR